MLILFCSWFLAVYILTFFSSTWATKLIFINEVSFVKFKSAPRNPSPPPKYYFPSLIIPKLIIYLLKKSEPKSFQSCVSLIFVSIM